ncbi:hypothetical protein [Longivirga aurantiaca]|uniref:Uncharacterized protein n=1 Tax=Longivirga aurantiaca TaxID=1837743 RepID=A0ABW1T5B7_9ACTN
MTAGIADLQQAGFRSRTGRRASSSMLNYQHMFPIAQVDHAVPRAAEPSPYVVMARIVRLYGMKVAFIH